MPASSMILVPASGPLILMLRLPNSRSLRSRHIPKPPPENLAGSPFGECSDDLYLRGYFVFRNMAATIVEKGGALDVHALPYNDEGFDDLAERLVGNADDRALADGLMRVKNVLDVHRIDVGATPNDQILLPSDDVEEAVSIELAEIAASHPAIHDGLGRRPCIFVIAAHQAGTSQDYFPHVANVQIPEIIVDNTDLAGRKKSSAGVGTPGLIAGRIVGRDRPAFGHAP